MSYNVGGPKNGNYQRVSGPPRDEENSDANPL